MQNSGLRLAKESWALQQKIQIQGLHFLGNVFPKNVKHFSLPSADLKGLGCLNQTVNFILFTIFLANNGAFRHDFSK